MNEEQKQVNTEIARVEQQQRGLSIFDTSARFEHYQRVAKAFAASDLVPAQFKANIPNVLIALDMADRLSANPLAIMQSIYIVHGKPSWSATFIISCINSCGRFEPLRFEVNGNGEDKACYAWTRRIGSQDKIEGPPVSLKMAKAEGWLNRPGSKWQTMPDLMLRYRAATFFGRLYAPELLLGMSTAEEIIDVEGAEPANPWKPSHGPKMAKPLPEPTKPVFTEPEKPKTEPSYELVAEEDLPYEDPPPPATPAPAPPLVQMTPVAPVPPAEAKDLLAAKVIDAGFNFDVFQAACVRIGVTNASTWMQFSDVHGKTANMLLRAWAGLLAEMQRGQEVGNA